MTSITGSLCHLESDEGVVRNLFLIVAQMVLLTNLCGGARFLLASLVGMTSITGILCHFESDEGVMRNLFLIFVQLVLMTNLCDGARFLLASLVGMTSDTGTLCHFESSPIFSNGHNEKMTGNGLKGQIISASRPNRPGQARAKRLKGVSPWVNEKSKNRPRTKLD